MNNVIEYLIKITKNFCFNKFMFQLKLKLNLRNYAILNK